MRSLSVGSATFQPTPIQPSTSHSSIPYPPSHPHRPADDYASWNNLLNSDELSRRRDMYNGEYDVDGEEEEEDDSLGNTASDDEEEGEEEGEDDDATGASLMELRLKQGQPLATLISGAATTSTSTRAAGAALTAALNTAPAGGLRVARTPGQPPARYATTISANGLLSSAAFTSPSEPEPVRGRGKTPMRHPPPPPALPPAAPSGSDEEEGAEEEDGEEGDEEDEGEEVGEEGSGADGADASPTPSVVNVDDADLPADNDGTAAAADDDDASTSSTSPGGTSTSSELTGEGADTAMGPLGGPDDVGDHGDYGDFTVAGVMQRGGVAGGDDVDNYADEELSEEDGMV